MSFIPFMTPVMFFDVVSATPATKLITQRSNYDSGGLDDATGIASFSRTGLSIDPVYQSATLKGLIITSAHSYDSSGVGGTFISCDYGAGSYANAAESQGKETFARDLTRLLASQAWVLDLASLTQFQFRLNFNNTRVGGISVFVCYFDVGSVAVTKSLDNWESATRQTNNNFSGTNQTNPAVAFTCGTSFRSIVDYEGNPSNDILGVNTINDSSAQLTEGYFSFYLSAGGILRDMAVGLRTFSNASGSTFRPKISVSESTSEKDFWLRSIGFEATP